MALEDFWRVCWKERTGGGVRRAQEEEENLEGGNRVRWARSVVGVRGGMLDVVRKTSQHLMANVVARRKAFSGCDALDWLSRNWGALCAVDANS